MPCTPVLPTQQKMVGRYIISKICNSSQQTFMNVRPVNEPRQGMQATKNYSCISYTKCVRLRDRNKKLEVRRHSEEDKSFADLHNLVLARIIW